MSYRAVGTITVSGTRDHRVGATPTTKERPPVHEDVVCTSLPSMFDSKFNKCVEYLATKKKADKAAADAVAAQVVGGPGGSVMIGPPPTAIPTILGMSRNAFIFVALGLGGLATVLIVKKRKRSGGSGGGGA